MADISIEVQNFRTAIYGEEVRGSMISLAEKLNTEMEATTENANSQLTDTVAALSLLEVATADANNAANAANTANVNFTAAENDRVTAEASRVLVERARVTAENARVNAENSRVINETTRRTTEAERIATEQTRQDNEYARQQNEDTRQTNENTRQVNERNRVNKEADRVIIESQRVMIEQQRVANEAQRQLNEQQRIQNENDRIDRFADLSQQVMPTATRATPGAVIIGTTLDLASNGTINVPETYAKVDSVTALATSLILYLTKASVSTGLIFDEETGKLKINPDITWDMLEADYEEPTEEPEIDEGGDNEGNGS